MPERDDDIEKVRRSEQRLGKPPVDEDLIRERNARSAAFRKALEHHTTEKLTAFMLKYGFSPDSPEWSELMKIWTEQHERDNW